MSNNPQNPLLAAAIAFVRVTILPGEVKDRSGEFTNDSGEKVKYETRNQPARLEVNGFAYPYDVRLDKGQPPYAAGEYVLDLPGMLEVNKSKATISKFAKLVAVKAA